MEISTLTAKILESRQTEAVFDGATFKLQLPSSYWWRCTLEQNRDMRGRILDAQAFRALVDKSLIGWQGVKESHVVIGGGDHLIEFTKENKESLLEERQDIADELTLVLGAKIKEREELREAASKNS